MARMMPGDPRFAAYDELQRTICVAINLSCHFDAAQLPIDRLMWNAKHLPKLVKDMTEEMAIIARTGLDE